MALSKARDAALKCLVMCERDGAYLNLSLRECLAAVTDSRDAALATVIATGVVRNRLYIDNIIENLSSVKIKKLSVWIHNILRMGVFSLKFLDKVPASAAVNECVRLARRYGHAASAGYVNALLRRAASSGDFLPREGTDEYLSVKYSLPMWLVKMWKEQGYGEELFALSNETPKTIVRKNTLKDGALGDDFVKMQGAPDAYEYIGAGSCENTPQYKAGLFSVQDLSSQKSLLSPPPKKGDKILDLCAAPGGKSAYMAALTNNECEMVCCDIHSHKLALIEKNFLRLGVKNASVIKNDAAVLNNDFTEKFDYVLVDAPCSGLGIIRRKPDIKWSKSAEDFKALAALQKKILNAAAGCVKKGGVLVYSTCTINRTENEDNAAWFLTAHKDFKITKACAPLGVQLVFGRGGTDGFYHASFERM